MVGGFCVAVPGYQRSVNVLDLQGRGAQGHDMGLVWGQVFFWKEVHSDVAFAAQGNKDVMVGRMGLATEAEIGGHRQGCCCRKSQRAVRRPCRVERRTRALAWLKCRVYSP